MKIDLRSFAGYRSSAKTYMVTPDGRELSYAAVVAASDAALALLPPRPGRCVALALSKPESFLPALLACWRRGLIPAMVDPGAPHAKFLVQKGIIDPVATLADAALPSGFEAEQVIRIDNAPATPAVAGLELKLHPATDPALLLFTSGSTGVPKCVPLSLDNLRANIEAFNGLLGIGAGDVFLSASPLWYAHGLYNSALTAFFLGATVVYNGPLNLMSVAGCLEKARKHGATVFHVTPSMLPLLAMVAKRSTAALPQFRWVICGTAKLEPEAKAAFEAAFGVPLTQQYGMSETLFMAVNHDKQAERPFSVGRPVGCQMELVEGEIRVKSPAAFGSYYHQREESAAAYADGWFLTGDLGSFGQDGHLTVTGRKKEIIKKGGFNVNPLEIDAALKKLPGVADAATVGVPDQLYGEEILSFVVGRGLDEAALLKGCADLLPATHLPRRVVVLDKLPLTSSGKVDKPALKLLGAPPK